MRKSIRLSEKTEKSKTQEDLNRRLQAYDAEFRDISPEVMIQIANALKNNTKCKHLNLKNYFSQDRQPATRLREALETNSTLQQLHLSNVDFGDSSIEPICEALKKNKTMLVLSLMFIPFGENGCKALGEALEQNATLQTLYLIDNQFEEAGCKALKKALEKNSTLIHLHISTNPIGDAGAKALATTKQMQLLELNLLDADIGDIGAEAISELLRVNNKLLSLELHHNRIKCKGAICLSAALMENKNSSQLRRLHLQDNQIGDDGIKAIGELMKSNTKLNFLSVRSNLFGDSGGLYLSEALLQNTRLCAFFASCPHMGSIGEEALTESFLFSKAPLHKFAFVETRNDFHRTMERVLQRAVLKDDTQVSCRLFEVHDLHMLRWKVENYQKVRLLVLLKKIPRELIVLILNFTVENF